MNAFEQAVAASTRIGTPMLLAGLGEMLLERSGLINIGIEGVMLSGAFVGFCISSASQSPLLGAAAGAATGALLMIFFAVLVLRFNADQIVTGMALNLIASGLAGVAYMALQDSLSSHAATFKPLFLSQTLLTWAALLFIPLLWFYIEHTERGLELRACGENPSAAEASGIDVLRCRFNACCAAGALAGLGGAFLTISQTASFAVDCTAGRGFVALAAVVLGRHSPLGTAAACLLFGGAFYARDAIPTDGVSPELIEMLPYLLALGVLCLRTRVQGAPAALGKPWSARR